MDRKIILASASPRRKELLSNIGLDFEVITPQIEEKITEIGDIETVALEKAFDVAGKTTCSALIIGSDTVVTIDNKILGKPADDNEAFSMLKLLSGRTHSVISAIAVYDTITRKTIKDSIQSRVTFRELDDGEIRRYIATGEPVDKAGAYAIQGRAGIFVKNIDGCYFNIMGISVYRTAEILREFGVMVL